MKSKEELQLVRDWLRLAQKNLQVSQSTVSADYAPYHTVCFLCQGSAERYLKTFLIHQGWELKKTHDLNELLLFCVDFDPEFETLREDCEIPAMFLLMTSMNPKEEKQLNLRNRSKISYCPE
jgi:HEPN domain-containing protein